LFIDNFQNELHKGNLPRRPISHYQPICRLYQHALQ
jgi:hypothetical protein